MAKDSAMGKVRGAMGRHGKGVGRHDGASG